MPFPARQLTRFLYTFSFRNGNSECQLDQQNRYTGTHWWNPTKARWLNDGVDLKALRKPGRALDPESLLPKSMSCTKILPHHYYPSSRSWSLWMPRQRQFRNCVEPFYFKISEIVFIQWERILRYLIQSRWAEAIWPKQRLKASSSVA